MTNLKINFEETNTNEYNIGLEVEHIFRIISKEIHIGYIGTNTIDDCSLFIEWVEIFEEYRKKSFLRKIIKELILLFDVKNIRLECDKDYLQMYKHIGCKELEYDDFRGMFLMEICR